MSLELLKDSELFQTFYTPDKQSWQKKAEVGLGAGHASQQSDNRAKVACCNSLKVGLHKHAKLVVQEFLICYNCFTLPGIACKAVVTDQEFLICYNCFTC